ncbi:MAG: hypothetical protein WEE36_10530 [Acidimicrobiia bacterium]
MTSADPRHGRWILPLMIAAMVVLTYTFVNNIEPAASPSGTTVAGGSTVTSDPDTSTTTLPQELAAFMVTVDILEDQAIEYGEEVDRINADWDNRTAQFAETRTALVDLAAEIEGWETDVAQVSNIPPVLAASHVALLAEVSDLAPTMTRIIAGLDASDDGTLRRAATAEFQAEIQQVLDAIETIRETARASVTPTTDAEA